jgi:outer membrane protein TolC
MNIRITGVLVIVAVSQGFGSDPVAAQESQRSSPLPAAAVTVNAGPQVDAREVPLTLTEAVEAALEGNRALRAAGARAQAAESGAGAKAGFTFPSIQATAGLARTSDPVGVFGTKLRQRRFEQGDFDIGALNDPDPVTDWTAGVGAQWDIAMWDRWLERDAGEAESRAAHAVLARTREGTVYRTRVLYVAAIRAEAGQGALEAAEASARATTDRVRRRVEEGMGTEADLLQAQAAVSGIQARLEHARAAVMDAREALGSWLGWPADRLPVPTQGARLLTEVQDPGALPPSELGNRADLVAGRAGVEAAEARARVVTAKRLPGLQAFGQLSTHAPGIGDTRENHWTVGVQLSVPLFTGFSLTRGAEAAQAQARALRLGGRPAPSTEIRGGDGHGGRPPAGRGPRRPAQHRGGGCRSEPERGPGGPGLRPGERRRVDAGRRVRPAPSRPVPTISRIPDNDQNETIRTTG